MSDPFALTLALCALAAALTAAVTRTRLLQESVVACAGAALLLATGATTLHEAREAVAELGSTVCFLAALLVLAEGCRREGLFDAIGALLARRARGSARALLALVFGVATAVTVVLSLDATVVLLTPIVLVTATRLRTSPRPHVVACAHLANSASLLLPVSNLTNLLAFHASGLSFTRFGALMALPWIAAIAVEWTVLSRWFRPGRIETAAGGAGEGDGTEAVPGERDPTPIAAVRRPRLPLAILALTLAGFALSSLAGVQPVWIAAAGAVAITLPALARRSLTPPGVARAADPAFLLFVLALGVIVGAASRHGLESAMRHVLPGGSGLLDLLAIAAVCALLANAVNNLPAILIALPALAAAAGPGPVLAALIGVNIGPNLTYVGSLATLLWRRALRAGDAKVSLREFTLLGLLSAPAAILAATCSLWIGLQLLA